MNLGSNQIRDSETHVKPENNIAMLGIIFEYALKIISKSSALSKKERQIVLSEITNALNQTRVHIRNTRKGNIDEPSSLLSNTWLRAGQQLRKIQNQEIQILADTIEQKSKYWSDPIGYEPRNLEKYEMRLSEVEAKLKEIRK